MRVNDQQMSAGWGPNQAAFFDRITNYLTTELALKGRSERANKRMVAALVGDLEELAQIPNEKVTEQEALQHEMYRGFLALFSLISSTRSVEYYFRRFRFVGLPVTMADHLQNSCEMYFDRIGQFRDRMKFSLNTARKLYPDSDLNVGGIVRAFDKAFDWDIRQRNRVHHKGRYDDQYIDQLSMLQLMELRSPTINKLLSSRVIHRTAVNVWVKKVRLSSDALDKVLEQLSAIMLQILPVPPGQTAA